MKKIIVLFIFTLIIFYSAYAVDTTLIKKYFIEESTGGLNNLETFKVSVYSVLVYLGYSLAACVGVITGLQFLTANAQKKAQLKEKLWLILLGIIVLAAGGHILQLVADLITSLANAL